ncbi:MAG: hypothetical protein JO104_01370 [Candidatus Eremiobacteraeota bacterium]|nr:hypothetical protein [Candidatus Eremiobacteraeota bacterium]
MRRGFMIEIRLRPAVAASVTFMLVAACSGDTPPLVSGSIASRVAPHPDGVPMGWPKTKKNQPILFVADLQDSGVWLFDPRISNPPAEGLINDGISNPAGLAVDASGTLYVANIGNQTITEYSQGSSSPRLTRYVNFGGPYGIAVDSKGDIFVSNLVSYSISGFKPGEIGPYETIDFMDLGQPTGVAVDGRDNVWVACDSTSSVFEIPAGSSTPKNANLSALAAPNGIAFGPGDVMYVANFGSASVNVYAYGSTAPSETITAGIENSGPTLNGFTRSGMFFQSNQSDDVVGYRRDETQPFSTIVGFGDPVGIASTPEARK